MTGDFSSVLHKNSKPPMAVARIQVAVCMVVGFLLISAEPISCLIVSITKYSPVIGSPRAYLLRNCSAVTWVSNYSCPI